MENTPTPLNPIQPVNPQLAQLPPQQTPAKPRFWKSSKGLATIIIVVLLFVGGIAATVRAVQVARCDKLVRSCSSFLGNSQSPQVKTTAAGTLVQNNSAQVQKTSFTDDCQPNAQMVSSCRPLIGATSNNYPGITGWKNHVNYLEKRAGHELDIAHTYHGPTQTSLSSDELSFVNRNNTYLYMNWKPDASWGPAGGGNSTVNSRIDHMADSIKGLGNKKIFLAIYAEPENDISKGGSKCSYEKGNKGTTEQYRDMWRNVRKRFDAKGVKNVVWTMNYMGYSGWDCAVKDMWPGNDLVDWITWDPYTNDQGSFKKDISRFYDFMTANTDASHAFTSKNWGIAEMGYEGSDQSKAYKYYDDMLSAIKQNQLPRMRMYMFFDMNGVGFGSTSDWDSRIGYSRAGKVDATEQQHFNRMLSGIMGISTPQNPPTNPGSGKDPSTGNNGGSQPTQPGTPVPTVSPIVVQGLANDSTVRGAVSITGVTNTKEKVQLVTMRVDGDWIATDYTAPYTFNLDTTQLKSGQHTVLLRIMIGGKKYDSDEIRFTVDNTPVPAAPVTMSGLANGATVSGTVALKGYVDPKSSFIWLMTMRVDGQWIATDDASPFSFNLDTRKLKNGQHSLILRGWGHGTAYDTTPVTFTVKN